MGRINIDDVMKRIGTPNIGKFATNSKWEPKDYVNIFELSLKGYSIDQIAEASGITYNMVALAIGKTRTSYGIAKEIERRGLSKFFEGDQ